eukprot:gnl/Chilomastix_cuspidata/1559.p1 GENE.gnl/Chilomastix_cuspidata/1559~~gnl/Chilomastix_cuspidata/1559.p1  ORF type:complete len:1203 (-),score=235.90 gnl/Chilomastix_cuspidata/1559:868-4476(-)
MRPFHVPPQFLGLLEEPAPALDVSDGEVSFRGETMDEKTFIDALLSEIQLNPVALQPGEAVMHQLLGLAKAFEQIGPPAREELFNTLVAFLGFRTDEFAHDANIEAGNALLVTALAVAWVLFKALSAELQAADAKRGKARAGAGLLPRKKRAPVYDAVAGTVRVFPTLYSLGFLKSSLRNAATLVCKAASPAMFLPATAPAARVERDVAARVVAECVAAEETVGEAAADIAIRMALEGRASGAAFLLASVFSELNRRGEGEKAHPLALAYMRALANMDPEKAGATIKGPAEGIAKAVKKQPLLGLQLPSAHLMLLASPAYQVRCAALDSLAVTVANVAELGDERGQMGTALLGIIRAITERLLDVNAFARSHAVQALCAVLQHVPPGLVAQAVREKQAAMGSDSAPNSDGNGDDDGEDDDSDERNEFSFATIASHIVMRIHDSSSAVRSEAIKALRCCVEFNPYGPTLSRSVFEAARATTATQLDALGADDEEGEEALYQQDALLREALRFVAVVERAMEMVLPLLASSSQSDVKESCRFLGLLRSSGVEGGKEALQAVAAAAQAHPFDQSIQGFAFEVLSASITQGAQLSARRGEHAAKADADALASSLLGHFREIPEMFTVPFLALAAGTLQNHFEDSLLGIATELSRRLLEVARKPRPILSVHLVLALRACATAAAALSRADASSAHLTLSAIADAHATVLELGPKVGLTSSGNAMCMRELLLATVSLVAYLSKKLTNVGDTAPSCSPQSRSAVAAILDALRAAALRFLSPSAVRRCPLGHWFALAAAATNLLLEFAPGPTGTAESLIRAAYDLLKKTVRPTAGEQHAAPGPEAFRPMVAAIALASFALTLEQRRQDDAQSGARLPVETDEIDELEQVFGVEPRAPRTANAAESMSAEAGEIVGSLQCLGFDLLASRAVSGVEFNVLVSALCRHALCSDEFAVRIIPALAPLLGTAAELAPEAQTEVHIAVCSIAARDPTKLTSGGADYRPSLFAPLRSSHFRVREQGLLMVGSLITADMLKPAGRLGHIALLLNDPVPRIRTLAKLLLQRLSARADNPIFNNFSDIISTLSHGERALRGAEFRMVVKYLMGLIRSARHADSLLERLASHIKALGAEQMDIARNLAFCITQLNISFAALPRLELNVKSFGKKLQDDEFRALFTQVLTRMRKKDSARKHTEEIDHVARALAKLAAGGRGE